MGWRRFGAAQTANPLNKSIYDSATVNGTGMTYAKGRLAEAYTGASKTTDLGYSYSLRGEVTDVYQSTPIRVATITSARPTGRMAWSTR